MSIKKCFKHFDTGSEGCVDIDKFKVGLSRLGININVESLQILMEMIGRVSGLHFREIDLHYFIHSNDTLGKRSSSTTCMKNDII